MRVAGWPYPIDVDGDFGQGASATITVDCRSALRAEQFNVQRHAIEVFVGLAAAGGLGGDRVAPTRSTAVLTDVVIGGPGAQRVTWNLSAIAIDVRGLVVLFNALSFLVQDIAHVAVRAQAVGQPAPLSIDELPPQWAPLPFALEDDRTGPNVELQIEFAATVPSSKADAVDEALHAWLDCGSIQGFRDWSESPEKSLLLPTDEPTFALDGDELSAVLDDSGVLEGCYDILMNVLIRLNDTAPLLRVELV